MQRADRIPRRGIGGKIRRRLFGASPAHGFEAFAVEPHLRIVGADAGNEIGGDFRRRARIDGAEIGPGALLVALDQTRFRQQAQVPRQPRLRLAEDVDEVADRQVGVAQQRQQAHARRLAGGAQDFDDFVERQWQAVEHPSLKMR